MNQFGKRNNERKFLMKNMVNFQVIIKQEGENFGPTFRMQIPVSSECVELPETSRALLQYDWNKMFDRFYNFIQKQIREGNS